MADVPGRRPQDFRLLIGTLAFDPAETARGGAPAPAAAAARAAVIVQFAAELAHPDVVRLRGAYGVALDRYIPNLAYLERLPPATVERLKVDFLVRACIPLDPSHKLSPSLAEAPTPPGAPLELNVTLFDDADPPAAQAALGDAGARDMQLVDDRSLGGRAHVSLRLDDRGRVDALAAVPEVSWIEPAPVLEERNVDGAQIIQSGAVGQSPIWDRGLHGEGQVIGVVDDGPIDMEHCFFADAAPNKPGKGHRKVLAMFNDTGSPVGGHATRVAGIAAGDQQDSSGAHRHRGGAWAAKLVCSNSLDMKRVESGTFRRILNRAKNAGAFIHSNSWARGDASFYDHIARDVDQFSWENERHLVLAAGANTGQVNSPPATAKNTLGVMAAQAAPNHMTRGSGVDGPTRNDKRRKPEIVAVGCGLRVIRLGTPCGTEPSGQCATSHATPHAAAAAALVRQYFVEGFYPNGKRQPEFGFEPTGALIKAVLLNSTVDMTGEAGYPSDAEGWGLIRLDRTLHFDGARRKLLALERPRIIGLRPDEDDSARVFVKSAAEQLKVTLVWMDPPATEQGFAFPARNHIAMKTLDPDDVEYAANAFTNGVSDVSKSATDFINNVQMVIVDAPKVGTWTIQLRAQHVQSDDKVQRQGYALVVSGHIA